MSDIDFSTIPNATLYEMCTAGDATAWQYVYNYILVVVRDKGTIYPDTPEDVAQEVALRLIRRLLNLDNPDAFRAYIKRIAHNYFIDRLRRFVPPTEPLHGSGDDHEPAVDPPSPSPGPDAITHGKVLYTLFQDHMQKLSTACGEVLNVYFNYKICGRPDNYKEIAAQFGMTVGGVGVRIKRCLEELCAFPSIRDWIDDTIAA